MSEVLGFRALFVRMTLAQQQQLYYPFSFLNENCACVWMMYTRLMARLV